MNKVRPWLDSLDLGQYGDAFEENAVDWDLLPDLTDELLERLGIKALGHRMRILRAISDLNDEGKIAPPETPNRTTNEAKPIGGAERRQLTVMFCDLVGSVELGQRMELEDYRDLLTQVRIEVVKAVEQFHGFVARHHGDGVLVYFGYPMAREDDAERAVHAGLAVINAVQALDTENSARMRVGIATGAAIVGDILSTSASTQSELAALGATPNLAARLQAQARPNEVIVSDTTRQLCHSSFEFEAETLVVKGIEEPILAHRVLNATGHATRLDITSGRVLTPLVGRKEELALLARRWSQAREGDGQIVLICAEPGVGKTRIMMEAYRRFNESETQVAVWFCSPYHSTSALYPVIDYLIRTLKLGERDGSQERLQALEGWLDHLDVSRATAMPLLGPLLSLDLSGRYRHSALEGSEQRRRLLAVLSDIFVALAARSPLLLAVEDLHWVDPTTQDLLSVLVEVTREQPILGLFTFRPEYIPPWGNQRQLTTLTLNHLTSAECLELVRGLNTGETLSSEVIQQIVERTDGVPLFLEELSRAVLEAGQDEERKIPETLRDALTARLDRLGESRRIAQSASVIGRVFPWWLLEAASPLDSNALRAGLEQLLSSGLAYRRTLSGDEDYAFKHALVRDCAYQSLLRDERQRLHRRVAEALENAPSDVNAPPELLARHLTDGALLDRAVPLWRRAGEDAQRRGAFHEALKHFEAAAECMAASDVSEIARIELALNRAECLHFLARRDEALTVLGPHEATVEAAGDAKLAGHFFVSLGRIQAFRGRRIEALDNLKRAIRYARACGDELTSGIAHGWVARHQMMAGELETARENYAKAVQLLRQSGPSWELGEAYFRYGMLMTNFMGDFSFALKLAGELMDVADELDDPRLRCSALFIRGHALTNTGDWSEAEQTLQQSLQQSPNQYERTFGVGFLANLYLEMGDPAAAMPLIEEELATSGYRSREIVCRGICRLARAQVHQSQLSDAEETARRALSMANELEYWHGRFEANRLLAQVSLQRGELESARNLMETTLQLAHTVASPLALAQAQLDMAIVHHHAGDQEAAADLLRQARTVFERVGAKKYLERVIQFAGDWGAVAAT